MRRLLTTATIAAALCGTAVLGAAPSGAAPTVDVDPIALSTSRVSFTASPAKSARYTSATSVSCPAWSTLYPP